MSNSITTAQTYLSQKLDEVLKMQLLTKDLETPEESVRWTGAGTIQVKKVSFSVSTPTAYSRTAGFTATDVTIAWESFTLGSDVGNKMIIDAMDEEETGTSAVQLVNEYIRTIVVPSIDKARFTAITGTSSIGGLTAQSALTSSTVVAAIDTAIEAFVTNEIPVEGSVLYMVNTYYTFLVQALETNGTLVYGNFNGEVRKDIVMYRGVKVIQVPAGRLPALKKFILIQPKAVWAVSKHAYAKLFPAGTVPGFDGAQVDYRLYHGCGVYANKLNGVYQFATAA